jgi:hypothetical protein
MYEQQQHQQQQQSQSQRDLSSLVSVLSVSNGDAAAAATNGDNANGGSAANERRRDLFDDASAPAHALAGGAGVSWQQPPLPGSPPARPRTRTAWPSFGTAGSIRRASGT